MTWPACGPLGLPAMVELAKCSLLFRWENWEARGDVPTQYLSLVFERFLASWHPVRGESLVTGNEWRKHGNQKTQTWASITALTRACAFSLCELGLLTQSQSGRLSSLWAFWCLTNRVIVKIKEKRISEHKKPTILDPLKLVRCSLSSALALHRSAFQWVFSNHLGKRQKNDF